MTSEQYAFQLILHSGNARSIAYESNQKKQKKNKLKESLSMNGGIKKGVD